MKLIINLLAIAACIVSVSTDVSAQVTGYTSTINAAGGTNTINSNIYEWSVGEMTLVNTATGANIVVTQGVLQPAPPTGDVSTDRVLLKDVTVYPNPTEGILNMAYNLSAQGTLHYEILDIAGKTISSETIDVKTGTGKEVIDIGKYANGSYILHIKFQPVNGTEAYNSFKVEKIN